MYRLVNISIVLILLLIGALIGFTLALSVITDWIELDMQTGSEKPLDGLVVTHSL